MSQRRSGEAAEASTDDSAEDRRDEQYKQAKFILSI